MLKAKNKKHVAGLSGSTKLPDDATRKQDLPDQSKLDKIIHFGENGIQNYPSNVIEHTRYFVLKIKSYASMFPVNWHTLTFRIDNCVHISVNISSN